MKILRPHQTKALEMLRQSLRSGCRRPMIQSPTGSGKTTLASTIAQGARRKGNPMIFCVPAISLVDQTYEEFVEEGIPESELGVIQAAHEKTDPDAAIQIASVQTLMRRSIPPAGVVAIDEAHRWFSFYADWMSRPEWAHIPFIGLSATPWTKGLGQYYDDLLIPITTEELIDQKYLSPFRVFAPSHPDLSDVRTVAGDYHEGDLSEVMAKDGLVADVVDTWVKNGEGRPTLCFAVDRLHAKKLQAQFVEAGVSTGYIDAYTSRPERKEIARQFHNGDIQVVCNVGCLTTGIDWDVRCIVLARPTKSEMLFVQIIGRGLRIADGKRDCLIFDHTDTHLRLGFVTDIHHDSLDDGRQRQNAKPEKKEALPKACEQCGFVKPPKTPICPSCGYKPEPRSQIECEDGELFEVTPKKIRDKVSAEDKKAWYGMLKTHVRRKGYKPTAADAMFREKFGHWPADKRVPEFEPNLEVLQWIKSRQIAYSYRNKKAGRAA